MAWTLLMSSFFHSTLCLWDLSMIIMVNSSFLKNSFIFTVWLCLDLFIHSFYYGLLGAFQFLSVTGQADLSILAPALGTRALSSVGWKCEGGIVLRIGCVFSGYCPRRRAVPGAPYPHWHLWWDAFLRARDRFFFLSFKTIFSEQF